MKPKTATEGWLYCRGFTQRAWMVSAEDGRGVVCVKTTLPGGSVGSWKQVKANCTRSPAGGRAPSSLRRPRRDILHQSGGEGCAFQGLLWTGKRSPDPVGSPPANTCLRVNATPGARKLPTVQSRHTGRLPSALARRQAAFLSQKTPWGVGGSGPPWGGVPGQRPGVWVSALKRRRFFFWKCPQTA